MTVLGGLGCCCCGMAFDETTDYLIGCSGVPNFAARNALSLSLADLKKYQVLFIGPHAYLCGAGGLYSYTPTESTKIKDWLIAGGRLIAQAQNYACFSGLTTTRYNNFLGFLGSSMQMTTSGSGCGACNHNPGTVQAQPIVTGLSFGGIDYSGVSEITGGTALCFTAAGTGACATPFCFIAAERIGDGIVVATTNQYMAEECAGTHNNCEFFARLCRWKVDDMLV